MDTEPPCRSLSMSLAGGGGEATRGPPSGRPQHPPIRQLSDPVPRQQQQQVASSKQPLLPSPTHLIVMNPAGGNVLGVLGPDRLLAYLRLRLDELPYSSQMLSTIDSIPGLLWADRQRLFHNPTTSSSPTEHRRRASEPDNTLLEDPAAADYIPEPPIIYPSTACREALCRLTQWLTQLPAIPVIAANHGAAASAVSPSPLIGLLAPGDLLHFFLDGCPDTAANQPVSKILEVKLAHCRFLHECVCHTRETLADALDRMFRLRTPCLVLFDQPKTFVNSIHPTSLHGLPVGMLTAKDLLCAVVGTNPNHHHPHHHRSRHASGVSSSTQDHRSSSSNESKPVHGSSPMDVFDDEQDLAAAPLDGPQPGGGTLEYPSSGDDYDDDEDDDEASSSTGSTYSARSELQESSVMEANSDRRGCRCACHRRSSTGSELDNSVRLSASTSGSSRTNTSVRVLDQSSSHRQIPVQSPSATVTEQRKPPSGRRGDDDEALFSMD